jgi:hypothetical protein
MKFLILYQISDEKATGIFNYIYGGDVSNLKGTRLMTILS